MPSEIKVKLKKPVQEIQIIPSKQRPIVEEKKMLKNFVEYMYGGYKNRRLPRNSFLYKIIPEIEKESKPSL